MGLRGVLRRGHISTGIGALTKYVGADLAVFLVMLFALVCALLAGLGTRLREITAVAGIAGHKTSVHRREVGDIPTEAKTFGHLLAFTSAFISAPFARLGGFETVVDAFRHSVVLTNVVNLSYCHHSSLHQPTA